MSELIYQADSYCSDDAAVTGAQAAEGAINKRIYLEIDD